MKKYVTKRRRERFVSFLELIITHALKKACDHKCEISWDWNDPDSDSIMKFIDGKVVSITVFTEGSPNRVSLKMVTRTIIKVNDEFVSLT